MRKIMIGLLFSLTVLVTLSACDQGLKKLVPTGETIEIPLTVAREDSVWVSFPKSEFTRQFTFTLGKDFLNLSDTTWYERLRLELEKVYRQERREGSAGYMKSQIIVNGNEVKGYWISSVPDTQWLKENTKRGVNKPFLYAKIGGLPIDGELVRAVSKEEYSSYIGNHPEEKKDLAPMQILLGEEEIHTIWHIVPEGFGLGEGTNKAFAETLSDTKEAFEGKLLYRFSDDGRYVVIQLPQNALELTAEQLALSDFQVTITVPILQKKDR